MGRSCHYVKSGMCPYYPKDAHIPPDKITPDVAEFAGKVARVMKDLSSSHVFFILQQAFGEELDWVGAEDLLCNIISKTTKKGGDNMAKKKTKKKGSKKKDIL